MLFKKRRKVNGNIVLSTSWYGRFSFKGRRHETALSASKKSASALLCGIEKIAILRETGQPLDKESFLFLEGCPEKLKSLLEKWGVIDKLNDKKKTEQQNPTIESLVKRWLVSMQERELSKPHIEKSISYVEKICVVANMININDITKEKVLAALHRLRKKLYEQNNFHKGGKRPDGLSPRTANSYLCACKTFCSWLVSIGVMNSNPLSAMKKSNIEKDLRHVRWALEDREITLLLQTAINGKKHHGLSGEQRSLVYRLAIETGLRFSETRSRQWISFDFNKALVTVEAVAAKTARRPLYRFLRGLLVIYSALKEQTRYSSLQTAHLVKCGRAKAQR